MKRVIRCVGCSNITRLYGSYKVELKERVLATLTGEIKESVVVGQVCRKCAAEAGYKVKGVNIFKVKKLDGSEDGSGPASLTN